MQARFLRISELLPSGRNTLGCRTRGRSATGSGRCASPERQVSAARSPPPHRDDGSLYCTLPKENAEDPAARHRVGTQTNQRDNAVTRGLESVKKKMLADREVRAAYDALREEFDLARELIAARVRAGLTQAELAARMGTTQSAIARLESGAQLPSVKTLLRFASATRSRPMIKLRAA
jgi:DNA-binding XRE family transcriptional regulator